MGLGLISDEIVLGPSVADLINRGFLCKPVVYAPPSNIDLSGVKKTNGDYVTSQLESRVNKPSITGSAVEHYAKLAPGEPCVVFCTTRKHAYDTRDEFINAGFRFEVIHGELDKQTRSDILLKLAKGEIHGVTSVDILTTGTDIPCLSVGILLRPTTSLAQYLQSVGRILRPYPGKTRALILDHVGSCLKFGLPDDDREWSLEGVKKKKRSGDAETKVRQCPKCFAVFEQGPICPECQHRIPTKERKLNITEGELKEITKAEIELARRNKRREEGRAQTLEDLIKIEKERGYAKGWAYIRFNSRKRG